MARGVRAGLAPIPPRKTLWPRTFPVRAAGRRDIHNPPADFPVLRRLLARLARDRERQGPAALTDNGERTRPLARPG